jgi:putative ABC transport system ATP-binding protein
VTVEPAAALLELRGVGVRVGERWVLHGIDLAVQPGELLGIAGPSGAGKTVLCAVLAGVLAPSGGSVRYGGEAMADARPTVGLILQNHGLLSGLTAAENVAFPLQARSVEREAVARRVDAALGAVGLSEQKDRPVDELSGGQRQRVGVARALAAEPSVLVADEPTAELDPDNRERVLQLLCAHAARRNVVVIASDDPDVIGACDTVVHLLEGAIVRTTVSSSASSGPSTG